MESPSETPFGSQFYHGLSKSFRNFLHDDYLVDATFHCAQGRTLSAHCVLLAAAGSRVMADINQDVILDSGLHISVPDLQVEQVQHFIEALYTGFLPKEKEKIISICMLFTLLGIQCTRSAGSKLANEDSVMLSSKKAINDESKGELTISPCKRQEEKNMDIEDHDSQNNEQSDNQEKLPELCPSCGLAEANHLEGRTSTEDPAFPSHYKCCTTACSSQSLPNVKAFRLHMQTHIKNASLESGLGTLKLCPLCLKTRLAHKNKNEAQKPNKKGSLYRCCQCSASKLSAARFFLHTQNHLSKRFKCVECSKGYSYQHLLDQHVHREHGEGRFEEPLICEEPGCGYETKHKQSLVTHIKEKHQGEKRVHKKRHIDHESPDEDLGATVVCPVCNKELKKTYYQQYHRKVCSLGTVAYKCDICNQSGFINQITLQNHVRSKHSSDRPYACEYCPAKYATAMSLSGHRARKHNVNKAGEFVPKKMFPCEECGKLLTSRIKLLNHVKTIHEQSKDFKCKFCDKRFSTRSNCKLHEGSMHTGDLPYKCELCTRSFRRKALLANHVQAQHELWQALAEAVVQRPNATMPEKDN